jgi:hypothetical protein
MMVRQWLFVAGILTAFPAHAQLTSLSPDLIVDCSVPPCTIKSAAPIVKNSAASVPIDQTYVALTLLRNAPVPMADTIVDPAVIGSNNALGICTMANTDHISAATPVINGRLYIDLAPYQCVDFLSDGSQFIAVLSWQASARQRCPNGQHMVSAAPFICTP